MNRYRYHKLFVGVVMMLLIALPASAQLYIYQESDGTRWFTDHPLEDHGYRLLRRLNYKKVARTCDGLSKKTLHKKADPYESIISTNALVYNIEEAFIKAIIHVESCFNKKALSRAGAAGLMQLMPATAKRFGVTDRYDPQQNIRGGVKYLRVLTEMFKNNKRFILAAYNAGEGAVKKYNDIPPYRETQGYVKRVLKFYDEYRIKNKTELHKAREEFVESFKQDSDRYYD